MIKTILGVLLLLLLTACANPMAPEAPESYLGDYFFQDQETHYLFSVVDEYWQVCTPDSSHRFKTEMLSFTRNGDHWDIIFSLDFQDTLRVVLRDMTITVFDQTFELTEVTQ